MRIKSENGFAVVKDGKISATDIYAHDLVTLYTGEEVVPVLIIPLTRPTRGVLKQERCSYCNKKLLNWKRRWCSDLCVRKFKKEKELVSTLIN